MIQYDTIKLYDLFYIYTAQMLFVQLFDSIEKQFASNM